MGRKAIADIDKQLCSVEGCENIIKARKLCSKHHQQWYRSGKIRTSLSYEHKRIIPRCKTSGCENSGHPTLDYCAECYEKIMKEITGGTR